MKPNKFLKTQLKALAAVALAGCSFVALSADNQLTSAEANSGWKLLFDGKEMSQWRNFKKPDLDPKWVVEQGAMKLSAKGGGDIMTKASYKDFELKLDWKIAEAGNSGIFVLADELGSAIYSHAPEVQILDNKRHSDNKVDSHLSGSIYDMLASPESSHKPAGDWNQVTIKLQDSHLLVTQNGIVTASIVIGSSGWDNLVASSKFATWNGFGKGKSGHIGLQDHGDQVWFKNLKIREL